jgi:hypothetical protein|tara:strand:+ start:1553 stop:1753 length:201 start_codon:yes stop_codon:yes gene_type:complete
MPMGKGTYGSQVGRPKKTKTKAKGRKISWMFGGARYYGNVIRETAEKIFARTHNGKVKVINKKGKK